MHKNALFSLVQDAWEAVSWFVIEWAIKLKWISRVVIAYCIHRLRGGKP